MFWGQAGADKEQKGQLSGEVKAGGQRWASSGLGLGLVSPTSVGSLLSGTIWTRAIPPNLKTHPSNTNTLRVYMCTHTYSIPMTLK